MSVNLEFSNLHYQTHCTNCGKALDLGRDRGTICPCTMARMQCLGCGQLVYRTGISDEGLAVYSHETCGAVTEYGCRDIRTLPVRYVLPANVRDPHSPDLEVEDIHVRRGRVWHKPWTWLSPAWLVVATLKGKRTIPKVHVKGKALLPIHVTQENVSVWRETWYACPDCKGETSHLIHPDSVFECRECGSLHGL